VGKQLLLKQYPSKRKRIKLILMNLNPYIPGILDSLLAFHSDKLLKYKKDDNYIYNFEFYYNGAVQLCKSKALPGLDIIGNVYTELVIKLPFLIDTRVTALENLNSFLLGYFGDQHYNIEIGLISEEGVHLSIKHKNLPYRIKIRFEKRYNSKESFIVGFVKTPL
jgi:hypothetical protein